MRPCRPNPSQAVYRRIGAFTLIELLIVILIVGILIGLTLAGLKHARESARATTCMSSLRSLGAAVMTYAQSNHDLLPFATRIVDVRIDRLAPLDVLAQELSIAPPSYTNGETHTARPFLCPSDKSLGPVSGTSYRYTPADYMGIPDIWGPRPQFEVTRMYEMGPDDLVLFADIDRFHGRADRRDSSQVVLFSQAVRRQ